MLQIGELFFPDGEKHFKQYGEQIEEYGQLDRDAGYAYVKAWRRALDVGANVGIFSRDFAKRFDEVVAFEPVPPTRACLEINVPSNVRIEPLAISDRESVVEMHMTGSSGGSFVCNHPQVATPEAQLKPSRRIEVQSRTIDSFEFDAVDLIKLDIQGAEYVALLGARETILRHRPVIMIEEKPFNSESAEYVHKSAELLLDWGMTAKEKAKSDRIFVFED